MFYELVKVESVVNDATLAYGTAHPKPSQYPNHKLAAIKPDPNEPGMQRFYYLAERLAQEAYNWEIAEVTRSQWPRLVQTWVFLREDFTTLEMSVTAPSSYGRVWTRIEEEERRTGDEITDGLFIVLQVTYEDISNDVVSRQIDPDSGRAVEIRLRKVPAGTAAQQANALGYITEIEGLNRRWALSTKRPVSGLIGVGVRDYQIHRPWPWPPVLMGFATKTNVDGSFGFDYAMKEWDDECLIDVREFWSQTAPRLSAPTTLGKTAIVWSGALLGNINVPPCLHSQVILREEANGEARQRTYAATLYTDWPVSITVYNSVRPFPGGGYRVETYTIYSPKGIVS